MKTCIIINPTAGSASERSSLEKPFKQWAEEACWRTTEAGHAERLAARAIDEGFEQIIVAGGDGTVNEVVNGILRHDGGNVRIGVVPLGTGNDLVRTLAIPPDPRDALAILREGREVTVDAIQVDTDGRVIYGINVAAGGFSGQVDEVVTSELKETWGPLAYILGAASALPDLREYETTIAFEDGPEEAVDALNIIVANGRTVAGGQMVAPLANPCDGLLDVAVVEYGSVFEMASVGTRLMAGSYMESDHVRHRKARRVSVRSEPGMWFNIDGELITKEPLTFTVRPQVLRVLVGPEFRAEQNGL